MSEVVRFLLRVPDAVRDDLVRWVAQEDRSIDQQLVHILRQGAQERHDSRTSHQTRQDRTHGTNATGAASSRRVPSD